MLAEKELQTAYNQRQVLHSLLARRHTIHDGTRLFQESDVCVATLRYRPASCRQDVKILLEYLHTYVNHRSVSSLDGSQRYY